MKTLVTTCRHLACASLLLVLTVPVLAAPTPGGTDRWPWSNVINSLATNAVQIIATTFGVLALVWGVVTARQDGESGVKRIAGGILLASVAIGAPLIIDEVASLVSAQL